jgi:hypothetical protein
MKPISGNRATLPQAAPPADASPAAAHEPKGPWNLGAGAFKKETGTHTPAQGLAFNVCPDMPALPPDQCAAKLVADAKLALREVDIGVW